MIIVRCILGFVDPAEVGQVWPFATIAEAEAKLGWFFVHNNCEILSKAEYERETSVMEKWAQRQYAIEKSGAIFNFG